MVTGDPNPTDSPPTTNRRRGSYKRKKSGNRGKTKKVENLTEFLNPIPFIPKALDLHKHEDVLKRLGLYEFSKIELDRSIRTDLLAQLIVNYDSKKRCSYVNGKRVNVNRTDLAKALKLPVVKQGKGKEDKDKQPEVFSGEAIGFIEDFVFNWMLLHDESWVTPKEIVKLTKCIREGHPENLNSASLVWYKVEKELSQGVKLVDCYYASHLQYLIKSQHRQLFEEDGCGVAEEHKEKVSNVQKNDERVVEELKEMEEQMNCENITGDADEEHEEKVSNVQKNDELVVEEVKEMEEQMNCENITGDADEVEELKEMEEQVNRKEVLADGDDVDADEEHEETVSNVQEDNIKLTLGLDAEDVVHQEVKKDDQTMTDAEDCREEEAVKEKEDQVNWKNISGAHILQRCQISDLNDYEEVKVVEDIEDDDDKVEEEEDSGSERFDEGFDMEINDDMMDRDGLTDNFLQGVETSHIAYGSHEASSMDVFRSRDNSLMSFAGPSFFNNGGKRVMEPEEDMHHHDGNNKRLKTDEMWNQKQNEFGSVMMQMQQWMEKAKMIHDSKVESYVHSQSYQDVAMDELQQHHQHMEMVIKLKDEELEKKNGEVFRLEREVYLMGDLLAGYRKALNAARLKFSEYRKRFPLQEEPLYKDAGPGGLVLSTRDLEKQRLKQEEDMMKLLKSFEESYVYQLETQEERALKMAEKLVVFENEVKRLKEVASQLKETQKPQDELETSTEPEEKSHNVVLENDAKASNESVPLDAGELKEKGDVEKH